MKYELYRRKIGWADSRRSTMPDANELALFSVKASWIHIRLRRFFNDFIFSIYNATARPPAKKLER